MPRLALLAVLLAAITHAIWNLHAKRAAASQHFVWLYSLGSCVLYTPIVLWIVAHDRPHFELTHWLALLATALLHLGYSLMLQAGYRTSDLSLVYPLARGSGPLLSFIAAVLILNEKVTALAVGGVVLIVCGIILVAGLFRQEHRAPRAGIFFGLGTGCFIAAYTINDGWAVKVLLISPLLVDYSGNLFRLAVLSPRAWRDRARVREEFRVYAKPAAVVSALGPLGYILVLNAVRIAPVSHVAPARELATLLGAYFGARVLREKAAPSRILGALSIVAGVIGLTVSD
jgi:drug/metabolite transporter (DMT)-like permease